MNAALLSLRDVRVELGGQAILKGVDASIERGKITALIGLNGSGKTTLLRCILKELPCQGKIVFHCGHDHSRPNPTHVGYVPQKLEIEARMPLTVCDLLGLALLRRPLFLGIPGRVRQKMAELLQRVWLDPGYLERPVEKLSGGERQRVLLALALEPKPELLLLDEPAAGIDFKTIKPFYDLLAEINEKQHVTMLLVSHDLSIVTRHAHHVLCLSDGRIQCQGPPAEIVKQESIARTFGEGAHIYAHHHPADGS